MVPKDYGCDTWYVKLYGPKKLVQSFHVFGEVEEVKIQAIKKVLSDVGLEVDYQPFKM